MLKSSKIISSIDHISSSWLLIGVLLVRKENRFILCLLNVLGILVPPLCEKLYFCFFQVSFKEARTIMLIKLCGTELKGT